MRFTNPADYATMLKINTELINTVVDIPVVLYKVQQELSETNSYGEATKKTWYKGVSIPCLMKREQQTTNSDENMRTINVEQPSEFYFLRQALDQRSIYPEIGDIIWFDQQYYEIDNTNEIQLWAGRVEYNHSVTCVTHLTRKSNLQLEPPQL